MIIINRHCHPLRISQLLLILLFSLFASSYAFSMKVTFINPSYLGSIFWDAKVDFMRQCAQDLDIELNVIYLESVNGDNLRLDLQAAIFEPGRPDYLIGHFSRGHTFTLLDIAKKFGIGFYSINSRVLGKFSLEVGTPRAKTEQWLGMMYPDDHNAGYQLAKYLITKKLQTKSQVSIIAVGGGKTDTATIERLAGLQKALKQFPQASLSRVVHTNWSAKQAELKVTKLLTRYPQTDIIWAASDELAIGAKRAINNSEQLESAILTGGFDWSSNGIEAIRSGEINASLGGHFIEGGLALVLLHDYHNHQDFKKDPGLVIKTRMQLIDQDNVDKLFPNSNKIRWQTGDCMKLSKSYNNSKQAYNFNWEVIRPQ